MAVGGSSLEEKISTEIDKKSTMLTYQKGTRQNAQILRL